LLPREGRRGSCPHVGGTAIGKGVRPPDGGGLTFFPFQHRDRRGAGCGDGVGKGIGPNLRPRFLPGPTV